MIKCDICVRAVAPFRKYCRRCRRLVYRAGKKMAHVHALRRDHDERVLELKHWYTLVRPGMGRRMGRSR